MRRRPGLPLIAGAGGVLWAGSRVRRVRWLTGLGVLVLGGVWVTQAEATIYTQKTLPYTGLVMPTGVAVDAAGDVFTVDQFTDRVLELPAGGGAQVTLPFTGLSEPTGVAVDPSGDVLVTEFNTGQVLELPAGGGPQITLPFAGLGEPSGIAVDAAGDVFVSDPFDSGAHNGQVVELPAGGGPQATLAFTGLVGPAGVAVDGAGDVFVADDNNNRVLKLPAGGGPQVTLAFTGLSSPSGVAVDRAGDVFVTDGADDVEELPAGGGPQTTLPFSGLDDPQAVAVDSLGDVFVADIQLRQVLELSPVKSSPVITWPAPAAITYGTPLSGAQLDATASVPGAFVYTPAAGAVLGAGTDALTVTFTPTDGTDYRDVTESVPITVDRAPTTLSAQAVSPGLTATLTRSDTGAAVPGETIVFSTGSTTLCSATTDRLGVATCRVSLVDSLLVDKYGYVVTFTGDPNYLPSSQSHRRT